MTRHQTAGRAGAGWNRTPSIFISASAEMSVKVALPFGFLRRGLTASIPGASTDRTIRRRETHRRLMFCGGSPSRYAVQKQRDGDVRAAR
jgi:hypothetical protein